MTNQPSPQKLRAEKEARIKRRADRVWAYLAGKYTFKPPPVYHGNWNTEDWCNYVQFDDPALTGLMPLDAEEHARAYYAATHPPYPPIPNEPEIPRMDKA